MTRVVLLHGFAGGPSHVRAIADGRGVIAPTLSGHLGVPVPRAWTFDDEVDRIASLIDAPAIVVGYSLGGRLAIRLAERYPRLCHAALIVSAHPGLARNERPARRARDAEWANMLLTHDRAEFFARWDAQPLFATRQHTSGARVLEGLRDAHHPAQLSAALHAFSLADMPPLTLSSRVTIMAGALDTPLLARWSQPVVRVPNVGHDLVSEAPHAIAQQLELLKKGTHHDQLEA